MLKTNTEAFVPTGSDLINAATLTAGNTEGATTANLQDATSNFLQNMPDVVCLSHLRWDFVYQRPQHLLTRFARHGRLFYIEEPVFETCPEPYLQVSTRENNIQLVVPHLPHGLAPQAVDDALRLLVDKLLAEHAVREFVLWYYTPMALGFSDHLRPVLTVFDCMDELSAFKFAPDRLKEQEAALFRKADLVFTGGQSLYEAKKEQHSQVYAFPSSIDKAHFAKARQAQQEPADQAGIGYPRIGFFGVIDERMDLELLGTIADARPDWQFILLGPVVKIDLATLPQRPNLHYLGGKSYEELPAYVSGWNAAILPFAINESTRFISPTKTPEYLAAGKPVVSTAIADVIKPYGEFALVHIGENHQEFIQGLENALKQEQDEVWLAKVDFFLANISWDQTWHNMVKLMSAEIDKKNAPKADTSPGKMAG